jgi:hypothetical protein
MITGNAPINAIAILTVPDGTFAIMELTSDVADIFCERNWRTVALIPRSTVDWHSVSVLSVWQC